jgi:hypothetical protein
MLITAVFSLFQVAPPPPTGQAPVAKPVVVMNQEHPQVEEARLVREALDKFLGNKKNKVKTYTGKMERFRLHSDYKSSREPKKVLKACESVLTTFDWALGEYQPPDVTQWVRDDHPFEVLMIQKEEVYLNLIDEVLAVAPERLHPYLKSVKNVTGFTLYPAKLTVYYNDVKIQAEAKLDQSTAHNIAHLEMHRRYNYLPLWFAESVACAVEEMTFGEIWANWNRDGFVMRSSHAGWRGAPTQNTVKTMDLTRLWSYSANPYEDDMAHLGYAFAVFALEAQPKFFHHFALGMQGKYDKYPEQGGQYKLSPEDAATLASASFDGDLQTELRSYWEKVPKAPKVSKKRKVDLGVQEAE